jgi:hypothetical protein
MVPYVQETYDSQFEPTPNPKPNDPNAKFPRKELLRTSAGLVIYPSARLQELRLGGVYQRDVSAPPEHEDWGFLAALKFQVPVIGPISLRGDEYLRYMFKNDTDRITDLGLLVAAKNKLLTALGAGFSFYVNTDLFLVRGKIPANDQPGGSLIYGAGLEYSHIFKF